MDEVIQPLQKARLSQRMNVSAKAGIPNIVEHCMLNTAIAATLCHASALYALQSRMIELSGLEHGQMPNEIFGVMTLLV